MAFFKRCYRFRITAADPGNVLKRLTEENVTLENLEWIDDLTVDVDVLHSDFFVMERIIREKEIDLRLIRRKGILWQLFSLWKRPVLLSGLVLFLVLSLTIPGRIFFVRVEGNETLSDKLIIQQAEKCGIGFAARATEVRSEHVKNHLLTELPELQWVGVTTSGCIATIRVKERSSPEVLKNVNNGVSSIVAVQDGIITEMLVYGGNPLFHVGQTVKNGDILISGYTDCGLKTTAQQAKGEVFAHTLRHLRVVTPDPSAMKGEFLRKHTCYRFRIGKKVINLCNHSGILDATCDKMYSEDYWTFPGGYQLPVSLVKVECYFHEALTNAKSEEDYEWLPQYARSYLLSQMIAGEILDESLTWNKSNGHCELSGRYACHEMIGQVKYEEILEQYAKDH